MCGRFAFFSLTPEVLQSFGVAAVPADLRPRYNIAPGQPAAVVRADGGRRLERMRWGLVPRWARDDRMGSRLINARAETLAAKPSFREAFRQRRCLVPADGFYEWKSEGKRRRPFFVQAADRRPLALAGLWEHWSGEDGPLLTFSIITCPAAEPLSALHERMPVILPPEAFAAWLETPPAATDRLREWLQPWPGPLVLRPVSERLNRVTVDDPSLLEGA